VCVNLGASDTLVSAPAGFGKTTLLSEWLTDLARTPGNAWR
jgi:ATP/maltotriose-dependent transcriptional regulator MalT